MFEVLFKVWWMIAILPFLVVAEAYGMTKKFMGQGKRWDYFLYGFLAVLIILLVILLFVGYR